MADFDLAFDHLIDVEGGYVDDGNDPGGETKYGISKRQYPAVDIAGLTLEGAAAIYRADYWDPLRLSEVENQDIATEVFEAGVNVGPKLAVRWLQKSLNLLTDLQLLEDAQLGPKTLAAVNGYPQPRHVLLCLNGFQFDRYRQLCEQKPATYKRYFRGWLKRVAL